jgi:transcription termination/antitermination protein NusA
MTVSLGENDVKTVEDLAGLVPDDLRGWFETKDGERVRQAGALESFNLTPEDAETLIMRARVVMGWVEAPPEPEYAEEDYAEGEYESEEDAVFGEVVEGEQPESAEAVDLAEAEGEARDA